MSKVSSSAVLLLFLAIGLTACSAAMGRQEEANSHLFSEAFQLMGRAASTSEVLSLNISNLLILLGLKFLIFTFGLITGGGPSLNKRSYEDGALGGLLSQSDMTGGMCFMMYAAGDPDKLSCLMRTACEDPELAMEYVTAARMWHKAHTYVEVIPFNADYHSIVNAVESAAKFSSHGGDCAQYHW